MPKPLSQCHRELSLPEILADPIVQAVMVHDGVTRKELEDLIARCGANRRARASNTTIMNRTHQPGDVGANRFGAVEGVS